MVRNRDRRRRGVAPKRIGAVLFAEPMPASKLAPLLRSDVQDRAVA